MANTISQWPLVCRGRDCHEFSQSPLQLNIVTVISKVDGFVACVKTSGSVRDAIHRTDTLYKKKITYKHVEKCAIVSSFPVYADTVLSQGRIELNKRQRFSSIRIARIVYNKFVLTVYDLVKCSSKLLSVYVSTYLYRVNSVQSPQNQGSHSQGWLALLHVQKFELNEMHNTGQAWSTTRKLPANRQRTCHNQTPLCIRHH